MNRENLFICRAFAFPQHAVSLTSHKPKYLLVNNGFSKSAVQYYVLLQTEVTLKEHHHIIEPLFGLLRLIRYRLKRTKSPSPDVTNFIPFTC